MREEEEQEMNNYNEKVTQIWPQITSSDFGLSTKNECENKRNKSSDVLTNAAGLISRHERNSFK